MATDPQIEKILRDQVDLFNENRTDKAEVKVDASVSGSGNADGGRRCSYKVFIGRFATEHVVSVWHGDGERFFPASTHIVVVFRSGQFQEEQVLSPEHLGARLSEILAAEEWDAR